MKLKIKVQDLKRRVDTAIKYEKLRCKDKQEKLIAENSEREKYNKEMEEIVSSLTEEDLKIICKERLKEVKEYYEARFLFFTFTMSYTTTRPDYSKNHQKIEIKGNDGFFLFKPMRFRSFNCTNPERVYTYRYETNRFDAFLNKVVSCHDTIAIGYQPLRLSSIHQHQPDPKLMTLWDNILIAESNGVKEVTLEEKDLELLNKYC